MKNRNGSTILIVISILVVILIIVTSALQNRSSRAAFTRFMSNEKKAEAIAEAVADIVGAKIRKESNEYGKEIYNLVRAKCSGTLVAGKNTILNMTCSGEKYEIPVAKEVYETAIKKMTQNATNYEIKDVKIVLSHAETFNDHQDSNVVGIMIPARTANIKPFPDSSAASPNRDVRLPFLYPPHREYVDGHRFTKGLWNTPNQVANIKLTENSVWPYETFTIKIPVHHKGFLVGLIDALSILPGVPDLPNKVYANLMLKYHDSKIKSESAAEFTFKVDKGTIDDLNDLLRFARSNKLLLSDSTKEMLDEIGTLSQDYIDKLIKEFLERYVETDEGKKFVGLEGNSLDMERFLLNILPSFKEMLEYRANGATEKGSLSPMAFQNQLQGSNSNPYNSKNYSIDTSVNQNIQIEKGGALQIKCTVEYKPSETANPIIRTLVTELPFKTSDIQPIAPQHTFFIANSRAIDEGNLTFIAKPLNLNSSTDDTKFEGSANLLIGNMNRANQTEGDKITFQTVYKNNPPAGKLRINGEVEPIYLYSGGLTNGINNNEINAIMLSTDKLTNDSTRLKLRATFGVYDRDNFNNNKMENVLKDVKIHFPMILSESTNGTTPSKIAGLAGLYEMYENGMFSDLFTAPTLLYGEGHMDYPLGNQIEGHVKTKLSEIYALCDPQFNLYMNFDNSDSIKLDEPWDSKCRIYYCVNNIDKYPDNGQDIPYGLPNVTDYQQMQNDWYSSPSSGISSPYPDTMPENCYSLSQYQKKASRYYDKISEFYKDCKRSTSDGGFLTADGALEFNGVIVIDDEEALDMSNYYLKNKKYKGNSLLVSHNISIESDIRPYDDQSSLGLIARSGSIMIENATVYAACFSNASPNITSSTIYGNLVCNQFRRQDIAGKVNVLYNSNITSVPAEDSSPKEKFNKFNKRRYYASIASNWSRSYYEKIQ